MMESKSVFDRCMDVLDASYMVVRRTTHQTDLSLVAHNVFRIRTEDILEVLHENISYYEAENYADIVKQTICEGYDVKVYIAHKSDMYKPYVGQ